MESHLADGPCAAPRRVELFRGEGSNAEIPDQGQTPQPAEGFIEIFLSKESQVGSGGDRGGVLRVWFGLSTGDSRLDLRQVI